MKKNLKLTVGIIALSAIVFLNLKYAYGGYGLSDNVLPKALATNPETTCGTDENGKALVCNSQESILPQLFICDHYMKDFTEVLETITCVLANGRWVEIKIISEENLVYTAHGDKISSVDGVELPSRFPPTGEIDSFLEVIDGRLYRVTEVRSYNEKVHSESVHAAGSKTTCTPNPNTASGCAPNDGIKDCASVIASMFGGT